jgi:hypothetical protein
MAAGGRVNEAVHKGSMHGKQQTHDLNITGRGAYVHNWVKWPEHESEHKLLSDVELTSGDIGNSMPL